MNTTTLYNFNPTDHAQQDAAAEILLLQLEEDGLAVEEWDEVREEYITVWAGAAYAVKEIAVEVRMTSPVGYAWAWAEGRLGKLHVWAV